MKPLDGLWLPPSMQGLSLRLPPLITIPFSCSNGTPWPKNSPNRYTGWTTVRTGIRDSINTIAVQSLQAVGVTEAFAFATEI